MYFMGFTFYRVEVRYGMRPGSLFGTMGGKTACFPCCAAAHSIPDTAA